MKVADRPRRVRNDDVMPDGAVTRSPNLTHRAGASEPVHGSARLRTASRNDIYLHMREIMEDTGACVRINRRPEACVHRGNPDIDVAPFGEMNLPFFKPA